MDAFSSFPRPSRPGDASSGSSWPPTSAKPVPLALKLTEPLFLRKVECTRTEVYLPFARISYRLNPTPEEIVVDASADTSCVAQLQFYGRPKQPHNDGDGASPRSASSGGVGGASSSSDEYLVASLVIPIFAFFDTSLSDQRVSLMVWAALDRPDNFDHTPDLNSNAENVKNYFEAQIRRGSAVGRPKVGLLMEMHSQWSLLSEGDASHIRYNQIAHTKMYQIFQDAEEQLRLAQRDVHDVHRQLETARKAAKNTEKAITEVAVEKERQIQTLRQELSSAQDEFEKYRAMNSPDKVDELNRSIARLNLSRKSEQRRIQNLQAELDKYHKMHSEHPPPTPTADTATARPSGGSSARDRDKSTVRERERSSSPCPIERTNSKLRMDLNRSSCRILELEKRLLKAVDEVKWARQEEADKQRKSVESLRGQLKVSEGEKKLLRSMLREREQESRELDRRFVAISGEVAHAQECFRQRERQLLDEIFRLQHILSHGAPPPIPTEHLQQQPPSNIPQPSSREHLMGVINHSKKVLKRHGMPSHSSLTRLTQPRSSRHPFSPDEPIPVALGVANTDTQNSNPLDDTFDQRQQQQQQQDEEDDGYDDHPQQWRGPPVPGLLVSDRHDWDGTQGGEEMDGRGGGGGREIEGAAEEGPVCGDDGSGVDIELPREKDDHHKDHEEEVPEAPSAPPVPQTDNDPLPPSADEAAPVTPFSAADQSSPPHSCIIVNNDASSSAPVTQPLPSSQHDREDCEEKVELTSEDDLLSRRPTTQMDEVMSAAGGQRQPRQEERGDSSGGGGGGGDMAGSRGASMALIHDGNGQWQVAPSFLAQPSFPPTNLSKLKASLSPRGTHASSRGKKDKDRGLAAAYSPRSWRESSGSPRRGGMAGGRGGFMRGGSKHKETVLYSKSAAAKGVLTQPKENPFMISDDDGKRPKRSPSSPNFPGSSHEDTVMPSPAARQQIPGHTSHQQHHQKQQQNVQVIPPSIPSHLAHPVWPPPHTHYPHAYAYVQQPPLYPPPPPTRQRSSPQLGLREMDGDSPWAAVHGEALPKAQRN
ncbi:unnamed protein product [Vitrella brassicaformis CCMP3155]|uniref:Uncharacterized protein n=3 Tax=Vitrella brassicaformis TaxID=1169539 RepID=A0A0G4G6C6_VITBC|nr:unnamed protein product [Vitrella brassicaformis CCMP3155]|eukprot:CEM24015.1 unnamed protein product [Vitrella brassicaformis CCMP3155]